jgi:FkbM family methyltransferase
MTENSIYRKLSTLLDISLSDKIKIEKTEFDKFSEQISTFGLILFGAGGFGQRTLRGLRTIGIEPLCFSDNNKKIWDTKILNLQVISPAEAAFKYPSAVFMITIWSDVIGHPVKEIKRLLSSYNENVTVISFNSLFWKNPEVFLPYFEIDLPHKTLEQKNVILETLDLWADEQSKVEYLAQVKLRINFDTESLPVPISSIPYIPENIFILTDNETIIDCGAFNGDTLRSFISGGEKYFKEYYAFEPDPINFSQLEAFVARLPQNLKNRIHCKQLAVSNNEHTIKFDAAGSLQSSERADGDIEVECIALDSSFLGSEPTYIKMDTEGAEPEIIQGSNNIIKNFEPILAVSVYHKFDHLWRLPRMIHSISNNYKFYLRSHCRAGWDLVCYAVPTRRL